VPAVHTPSVSARRVAARRVTPSGMVSVILTGGSATARRGRPGAREQHAGSASADFAGCCGGHAQRHAHGLSRAAPLGGALLRPWGARSVSLTARDPRPAEQRWRLAQPGPGSRWPATSSKREILSAPTHCGAAARWAHSFPALRVSLTRVWTNRRPAVAAWGRLAQRELHDGCVAARAALVWRPCPASAARPALRPVASALADQARAAN
jgi:hypothetical protein